MVGDGRGVSALLSARQALPEPPHLYPLCGGPEAHIYAAPQHLVMTSTLSCGAVERFWPYRTGSMQDPASELPRIPLPHTWVNKVGAFCIRARVSATNPPAPAGGEARRSTKDGCWWDATRLPPQPAGVPRCAGLLRAIALASPWPWPPAPTPRRPSLAVRDLP